MPQPTRITLPPSGRPVGGLLSAARPIGGQWWRGVTFSSVQCTVPQTIGPCPEGLVTKETQRPSDLQEFQAFGIIQAIECTTMGNTDVSKLAEQSLDVTREFAVSAEFLTGTASGNPSLADAAVAGAATDAVSALACLDQMAAQALSGRQAFIHASPALGTVLLAASAIWRDGRLWRTSMGSVVVVAPGYDGRAPGVAPIAPGASMHLYATGEVYAEVGERETLESVERGQNTAEAWSEEAAIVVFDPCFVTAVDTGVAFCDFGP